MAYTKLILASILCGGTLLVVCSLNESAELTPSLIKGAKYGVNNSAVYMTGCQAFPKTEAKRTVFAAVKRTFVSLPCALEVPPPFAAIEFAKRLKQETR